VCPVYIQLAVHVMAVALALEAGPAAWFSHLQLSMTFVDLCLRYQCRASNYAATSCLGDQQVFPLQITVSLGHCPLFS
jgi:hypothetical protein